jgi:uncharacterized membrane protein YgcG
MGGGSIHSQTPELTMKAALMLIASCLLAASAVSCKKKESTLREEVSDKVGDVLDTRDHEKLRDAAEDIEKDVKKAGEGLEESLKEVGEEIKKDVHEASE